MFEDNLSKFTSHFLCKAQKGALHSAICKSHSSPALITLTPSPGNLCVHAPQCHTCSVPWHCWCQDRSCPSTSQYSVGWNSFSSFTFSLSWPDTPPMCPVQESVPPWGWPRRLTARKWKTQFPARGLIQPVQSYTTWVRRKAEPTTSTSQHQENRRLLSETFPNGKKHHELQTPQYEAAGGCFKSTPMTPPKAMQNCNGLWGEHKVHTCNEWKIHLEGPKGTPWAVPECWNRMSGREPVQQCLSHQSQPLCNPASTCYSDYEQLSYSAGTVLTGAAARAALFLLLCPLPIPPFAFFL